MEQDKDLSSIRHWRIKQQPATPFARDFGRFCEVRKNTKCLVFRILQKTTSCVPKKSGVARIYTSHERIIAERKKIWQLTTQTRR